MRLIGATLGTRRKFRVCDSRQISFGEDDIFLIRTVEVRAVNGSAQVSQEHALVFEIQRKADAFHQMIEDNFRLFALAGGCVHRRSIDGVSARRVPAVGPVDHPVAEVEIKIDVKGFYNMNLYPLIVKHHGHLGICADYFLDTGQYDAHILTKLMYDYGQEVVLPSLNTEKRYWHGFMSRSRSRSRLGSGLRSWSMSRSGSRSRSLSW